MKNEKELEIEVEQLETTLEFKKQRLENLKLKRVKRENKDIIKVLKNIINNEKLSFVIDNCLVKKIYKNKPVLNLECFDLSETQITNFHNILKEIKEL